MHIHVRKYACATVQRLLCRGNYFELSQYLNLELRSDRRQTKNIQLNHYDALAKLTAKYTVRVSKNH